MKRAIDKAQAAAALAACGLTLVLTGCKAREMGISFADTQADHVDATWVAAVRSCWPELAHGDFTRGGLAHDLADPIHFRSAFSSYAGYSDHGIEALIVKPLMAATPPDTSLFRNADGALLTRAQAVRFDGNPPSNLETPSIPPDALCAVHPGTPVGF